MKRSAVFLAFAACMALPVLAQPPRPASADNPFLGNPQAVQWLS